MGKGALQRLVAVWISVLALVAQLLVPVAHAQAMRSQGADALAYLFCAEGSAALRALGAEHPQILQLRKDTGTAGPFACALCGAQAQPAAGLPQLAALLLGTAAPLSQDDPLPAAPSVRQLILPPLRAPPGLA